MNAPMNVRESWALYDTVVVCKTLYGKELTVPGWFTSFLAFASQESHTFFKGRTEGNCHPAYTNLKSADNVDFVFHALSFGVNFFSPIAPDQVVGTAASLHATQEGINSFWRFDLPRHCGIEFETQQDVRIESNCMISSPGYGPRGGGGAQTSGASSENAPQIFSEPWQFAMGSQGEPVIDNRFLLPKPISISRNSPIEATLRIGPYARHVLRQLYNNSWNVLYDVSVDPTLGHYIQIPSRWGIQVSLFGFREVQQRGQYHAPGAI